MELTRTERWRKKMEAWSEKWCLSMWERGRTPEEIDRDCRRKYGNLPYLDETDFQFKDKDEKD